jgi:hypothetical protein
VAAELAARGNPNITEAAGRLGDEELNIDIGMRRATTAADTPRDVRGRISADLERHQLLSLRVNVPLTGYNRKTSRELA